MMDGQAGPDQPGAHDERARELIAKAAAAEQRLLKQERKAERRLAEAQVELERDRARLARAEVQVQRRLADVAQAEAELRERQAARAAGPQLDPG